MFIDQHARWMSEERQSLESIIDQAIGKTLEDYKNCKWQFLSENDVVCNIAHHLENMLPQCDNTYNSESRFYVHTELRPYIGSDVLSVLVEDEKKDIVWAEQDKENSSSRIQ